MTASPKDQNGATDLSATVRQKIINDCGALMVRRPPLDTRIKDVSALPHPKEQILDALLLEIVRGRSQHIDNMMYVGMLLQSVFLAQYQLGVGDDPLEMLGVPITKTAPPPALLLSEATIKTRERFEEYNKLVEDDLKLIHAKIAAARALRR